MTNGIHLSCPLGTEMSLKDIKYGMISETLESKLYCHEFGLKKAITEAAAKGNVVQDCSKTINDTDIQK